MTAEKIGIVARSLMDENGNITRGGAEKVVFWLAEFLASRGFEVTVYQAGKYDSSRKIGSFSVKTVRGGRVRWAVRLERIALADEVRTLFYQDLSYAIRGSSGVRIVGISHGVYWDYPYVDTLKRWYPFGWLPSPLPRILLYMWRMWAKKRELKGVRVCDLVLAFDSGLLRIVQSDYPSLRLKIVRVGPFSDINNEQFSELQPNASSEVKEKRAQEAAGPEQRVLVPRNFSLSSGILLLPAIALALSKLAPNSQWVFYVAGRMSVAKKQGVDIDPRIFEDISGSDLGFISNRIRFLGSLDSHDFAKELEAATVVLIPTFAYEGACLAAVEAMSAGKAVVASNIGGLNDTIVSGFNGLLSSPSPKSLAASLYLVLSDAELRARLEAGATESSRHMKLEDWFDELEHLPELKAILER